MLFAPSCVGLVFSLFCLVLSKRLALVAHVWLEVGSSCEPSRLIYSKDKKKGGTCTKPVRSPTTELW